MTNIIDFSNGEKTPRCVVVQPNFQLANRNIDISYKEGVIPIFSVYVGCRTTNIRPDNIDQAISELKGEERPVNLIKVIVPKGINPKTTSARLQDQAGDWFISLSNKAFPTAQYEVKEINIKEKRKFFSKNPNNWDRSNYPMQYRGGYNLSKDDIDKIMDILLKMKNFFKSL